MAGILVILALILLLILMIKMRRSGRFIYYRAQVLEKEGRYKEACYEYAAAQLNSFFNSKYIRGKIKELWDKYGPFDYADELEKIKKDGDTPEKCGEAGHFAAMSIIDEAVTGKKPRRIVVKKS